MNNSIRAEIKAKSIHKDNPKVTVLNETLSTCSCGAYFFTDQPHTCKQS